MTNQIRTNGTKEYPSDVMNKEAKPAIAEAAIQEILPCPPLTAGLRDNIATLHAMHLPDEDISALISGKTIPVFDSIVNPSDGSSHHVRYVAIRLEPGREEKATILLNDLEIEQFFSQLEEEEVLISNPGRLLKEYRSLRAENEMIKERISVLQESIDAMKMLIDAYEKHME